MDQVDGPVTPERTGEDPHLGCDVFISYAREDRPFVGRLHDALSADGQQAWVDWEGIPASAKWMAEVRFAIDAAEAFCFVISPDSVESAVCREEAAHAASSNKRIVPVLVRDVEEGLVPETVATHNWIDFTDQKHFDLAFHTLARAIAVDPEWTRAHTRLLVRANEWEASGCDHALLLRGADLTNAEQWLTNARIADPPPARQHTAYIFASRKQAARRQRLFTAAVAVALAVALVLGGIALAQRSSAQHAQSVAEGQTRTALSRLLAARAIGALRDAPDRALLLAVSAWQTKPSLETQDALMRAVQQLPQAAAFFASPSTLSDTSGPLAVRPDETILATGGTAGLRLWDVPSRTSLGDPLTTKNVDAVAFSPDGSVVASAGAPPPTTVKQLFHPSRVRGDLVLWNVRTGEPVLGPMTTGGTDSLAFSPDGRTLATAGYGGVKLWSTSAGKQLGQPLTTAYAGVVAFSPDGRILATAGTRGPKNQIELRQGVPPRSDLQLWTVATRTRLGDVMASKDTADLSFSPDGSVLAAVAYANSTDSGDVRLFDVRTGAPLGDPLATQARAVSFAPDGQTLVTVGAAGLQQWTVTRAKTVGEPLDTGGTVDVAALGDGNSFITTGDRGIVQWSSRPYARLRQTGGGFATDVAFAAGGDHVIGGSYERGLQVVDVSDGALISRASVAHSRGTSLGISADGRTLVTAGSSGVRLWDVSTELDQTETITSWSADLAALSPDGHTVAAFMWPTARARSGLWLWDVSGDHPIGGKVSSERDFKYSLVFSPDGHTLALAGDKGLQLWDVATRQPLGSPITTTQTWAAAFSPDGDTLAYANAGEVVFWDLAAQHSIGEPLPADVTCIVDCLDFSPDGSVLAAAGADGLQLWNVTARQPLGSVLGPDSTVAISPDGMSLAAAPRQATTIWDLRPQAWADTACAVANRNLTQSEWDSYVGADIPYRPTCP
jgi:WD40 repeat protein